MLPKIARQVMPDIPLNASLQSSLGSIHESFSVCYSRYFRVSEISFHQLAQTPEIEKLSKQPHKMPKVYFTYRFS